MGTVSGTVSDLAALQTRLATDVQNQTNDIALIQSNLTQQLTDLHNQISALQAAQPTLDLTNITMSLNQLESNHAALLALAKQAAGVDSIPAPAPVIPTTPPSSDEPVSTAAPAPSDGEAVVEPAPAADASSTSLPIAPIPAE